MTWPARGPKREAELKAAAVAEVLRLCPGFLALRLADAGAPDRMIVGAGRATGWEFKHATPDFDAPGDQALFCTRLDATAHCRYVIWQEDADGGSKRTLIVRPRAVLDAARGAAGRLAGGAGPDGRWFAPFPAEAWVTGHDHRWFAERVREAHLGR